MSVPHVREKAQLAERLAARLEPGERVEAMLLEAHVMKWGFLLGSKTYTTVVTDRRVLILEREGSSWDTGAPGLLAVAQIALDIAQDVFAKTVIKDYPRQAVSLVKFSRGRSLGNLTLRLPTGTVLSLTIPYYHRDDAERIAGLLRPETGTGRS